MATTLDHIREALARMRNAKDPNDDSDDTDGDPNDDPRSYPDDDDDDGTGGYYPDDDKDDDDEDKETFRMLTSIQTPSDRKQAAIRASMKAKPKSRAEVKRNRLFELRIRNKAIRNELETNRLLALETKRNEEANLALYRSNMTPEQKRQQEEDTQRMATWAAGMGCKEASPNWREDARWEFANKKL